MNNNSPIFGFFITPLSGSHKPLIILSKDVFPHPEGPTTKSDLLFSMLKLKFLIIVLFDPGGQRSALLMIIDG